MKKVTNRVIALLLVVALVCGFAVPATAADAKLSFTKIENGTARPDGLKAVENRVVNEITYKATDKVRVSIVLEGKSTIEAGYSTAGIAQNEEAMEYNRELYNKQLTMAETISAKALNGKKLDVVWNMTLVGNIISANVPYGKIDAIKGVKGVKNVVIEQRYEPEVVSKEETTEPQMYTSGGMIGSHTVWSNGYTGAGSRVAIIDTGSDTDHQSLDNGAFLYALEQNAAAAGKTVEEYMVGLNLLDAEEIDSVVEQLNVYERTPNLATGEQLYLNEKLPFGYNYIDRDLDIVHDNDAQGEHGSHVAGIATANRFIPGGDGYIDALEAVFTAGVAPDAQLITMKVFGKAGGAYDSDYMAAIEDAIILGCDSVNLSLGSGNPGETYSETYGELLAYLTETDTVVVTSAGNSGYWAEETSYGYLYNDGQSFATGGTPGTFPTVLSTASVDNAGTVGHYFTTSGMTVVYNDNQEYAKNAPMYTMDTTEDGSGTEYEYVLIDGIGVVENYEGIDVTGKVVFCSRGETSFFEKANIAVELGAIATVIYNNTTGAMGLNLTGYNYTAPCVSILQSEGKAIMAASEVQTTDAGVQYYTGKLTVVGKESPVDYGYDYYTMSSFSSWGVPGDLSMKPEITAPGGAIYSLNGVDKSGKGYELMSGTSMASPQVAGMMALVAQYLRENGLEGNGITARALAQSLMMSTAEPIIDGNCESYYSILNQGSGLARVDLATSAESYILVDGQNDGKVKVQLGDDPNRIGEYRFTFSINNLNGEDMDYQLSADFFTQDIFSGGAAGLFLDTWTSVLPIEAFFDSPYVTVAKTAADVDFDANGDGVTDDMDAQFILEYAVGNETELKGEADVDGDGDVDTYDAHLLLTLLSDEYTAHVPANGSVTIDVVLTLPEAVRNYFDTYYTAGALLQAYVYAAPLANEEGVVGVTHSIPVLGYYGSWTEPSMFDVGSYIDYAYGLESRYPYLYSLNGFYGNTMSIDYGDGQEYYFGGNPLLAEDEYLPERNAMNNLNGSSLAKQYFALIRNAAASKFVVRNAETGEVYYEASTGEIDGAYYYVNGQEWRYTQRNLKLGWKGTDANGEPLPEGTPVEIAFIAAPDLYRTAPKQADWDALGDGAYMRNYVTIDNTAPVVTEISANLVGKTGINVVAQDNQYIAAIAIMNSNGTQELATYSPNQAVANEEVKVTFEEINASKFQVVVYDYALNASTYEVVMATDGEDNRPYFTAMDDTNEQYVGIAADGTETVLADASGRYGVAAEYVEGRVIEITENNDLYIAEDSDLSAFNLIANLDPNGDYAMVRFLDIAFNKADNMLYGLFYSDANELATLYLCTIDMLMGEIEVICEMPINTLNLAIDGEGNFYSTIYDTNKLYTYTLDTLAAGGEATLIAELTSYECDSVSSMAWDHNTNDLYYAQGNGEITNLLKIDAATGDFEALCQLEHVTCGLYIRPVKGGGGIFAPTDDVVSVTVDPAVAATVKGSTVQLTAGVWPWTVTDNTVTWTSSDEAIATVNENGLVTATGEGTVTITAASVLDPTKTATAEITVSVLNRTLNGLVWDEDGLVWWSEFNTDTLPAYTKLSDTSVDTALASVAYGPDGILYACDLASGNLSNFYSVDEETFELTKIGGSSQIFYADMAVAPHMLGGCMFGVYGPYVVSIDMATGEYMVPFQWTASSAKLVGIAYAGSVLNTYYNAYADYYYLVDADGNLFQQGFIDLGSQKGSFKAQALGKLGKAVEDIAYQSLYCDDSYLYWSRFNRPENVVELIVYDMNNGNIYSVGNFADGVWPVGGLFNLNTAADGNAIANAGDLAVAQIENVATTEKLERIELNRETRGNLNASKLPVFTGTEKELVREPVQTMTAQSGSFAHEIYVDLIADVDTTNGLMEITYDPAALEYVDAYYPYYAAVKAEEGKIIFAYAADVTIPAECWLGELEFFAKNANVETEIVIKTLERNDEAVELEETLVISATCPSAKFVDVPANAWFHEAVDFVVELGIMNGASETKFNPNGKMDRAQLVTVLYRLAGSPEVDAPATFLDVPADAYYADAVAWAQATGVATGMTAELFGPKQNVTREQMVVFLARFLTLWGYEIPEGGTIEGFEDADKVSSYAVDAMAWAIDAGIINGVEENKLDPKGTSTRAQVATVIMRLLLSL